ncbi:MAG: hypothetical protein WBB85_21755 [Albidovulum sp.]|uniref:hypothetical protein n=1 Tax=Albidovulum sp. TaxID=1872424 RepID=UPI003C9D1FE0
MKPVTQARLSLKKAQTPQDSDPIELREVLSLIGQTPPDLENWLLDRRATDREDRQ